MINTTCNFHDIGCLKKILQYGVVLVVILLLIVVEIHLALRFRVLRQLCESEIAIGDLRAVWMNACGVVSYRLFVEYSSLAGKFVVLDGCAGIPLTVFRSSCLTMPAF
jgi:hypothetical protein